MKELFYLPLKNNCMFCRTNGQVEESLISLSEGQYLSTDTYFGCLPCEPYTRNTTVQNATVSVRLMGGGVIELYHLLQDKETILKKIEFSAEAEETETILFDMPSTGCVYVKVTASRATKIHEIHYSGDGQLSETKIAVIICTYKREEKVLNNLRLLSETISSEPELKDRIDIICVDNGRSLYEVPEKIKLIRNRNYGGSGGYARGMIEALKSKNEYTHFWMMDDDIEFDPSILCRALSFIMHRKNDCVKLAAGMFSFETPTVQHEATASFNGFTFVSNGHDLDFKDRKSLLKNGIEYPDNLYGGWWSFIMPTSQNLPMPFFIKMDDVEYSLRCPDGIVIMNGFGVWHEAFGMKGNAWTEYYTTRNTLIVQALYPNLPHSPVKMMGIRLMKALAYGEPKCMEAACRGAKDFVSGPEKFQKADPEERHMDIMQIYSAPLVSDMSRRKMLRCAFFNMMNPKNWKSVLFFIKTIWMLRKISFEGTEWENLNTRDFWTQYLGINVEKPE